MEKYNSCYSAYLANGNLNISFPSEYLSIGVKEKAGVDQKSLNIALSVLRALNEGDMTSFV